MMNEDLDIEIQESDGKISLERSAFMFFGPPKIGKQILRLVGRMRFFLLHQRRRSND